MNETRTKDDLLPGTELTNQELSKIFHCGTMGGMRRAKATGTLVLNNIGYTVISPWETDKVLLDLKLK